jgi:hypothetical protein
VYFWSQILVSVSSEPFSVMLALVHRRKSRRPMCLLADSLLSLTREPLIVYVLFPTAAAAARVQNRLWSCGIL